MGEILRWNLPLEVAQQLHDASGDDRARMVLYRTVQYEENDGKPLMIATDTRRMFVAPVDPNTLMNPPSGLYRWIQRPKKDLQLVEPAEEKFPNLSKILEGFSNLKCAGAVNVVAKSYDYRLYLKGELNINMTLLPTMPGVWHVESSGDDKPLRLTNGDFTFVLMPMSKAGKPECKCKE